jgi:pilus assembly protein Flp/PilA
MRSLASTSLGKIIQRCHELSGDVLFRNMTRVQNFLGDESGVTAIEYALIASLIAVFIIVAVQYVGTQVSTVFTEVGNSLK